MDSFARELRLHCARKGSIAQLCKATGINRQQFNKYLAGQILPNARTMRKICNYLGVSEEQLMSGWPPSSSGGRIGHGAEIGCEDGLAKPGMSFPCNLKSGFYHAFFPVHGHPHLLACWLVQVTDDPRGGQMHSCRNRFSDAAALGFAARRITYRGPVLYGMEEACMIGTAQTPSPLQGVIYVNLEPEVGAEYYTAMVLTRRPDGPLALAGALKFLGPSCTARRALSGLGVRRVDDPVNDPVIIGMMRASLAVGPNWIQAVRKENPRPDRRSEGSPVPELVALRRLAV